MNDNSTKGMTAALTQREARLTPGRDIAAAEAGNLERSCTPAAADRISVSPANSRIERIEARFRGNGFEPHRHDTYAIGVTLQGVQTFLYRGAARYSEPGNVIVLHPDELHDGAAGTEDGLRYRMLYLPPELLVTALGDSWRSLPFVASPVLEDAPLQACLLEALSNLEGDFDGLVFDDVLARLADGLARNADGRDAPIGATARSNVLACCAFLAGNIERQVGSEELEAISGMDRYALSRQFRRVVGTSPHRYLVMRRLDRARTLMASGMGLADIAAATGFSDQSHLTRHFKKTHGMTPHRWAMISAQR